MTHKINKILDRLFETATRPFELFNSAVFLGYGYVFWVDGETLYTYHIYKDFATIPLHCTVAVFFILGLAQGILALRDTCDSNILSGYLMLLCGLVWLFVFCAFSAPYPPLNTGMVYALLMCVACVLCGKRLIDTNKTWKHTLKD